MHSQARANIHRYHFNNPILLHHEIEIICCKISWIMLHEIGEIEFDPEGALKSLADMLIGNCLV